MAQVRELRSGDYSLRCNDVELDALHHGIEMQFDSAGAVDIDLLPEQQRSDVSLALRSRRVVLEELNKAINSPLTDGDEDGNGNH